MRADTTDIDTILLINGVTYLQLGPNPTDIFFEDNPFAVSAAAVATAPGSIVNGSFSLLGGQPISLTQTEPDTFLFVQRFATIDDASAAFPLGTYFFSLDGITPPNPFTATIDLANRFPATFPQLMNSEWFSVVVQADARQDFTFTWNSPAFSDFNTDPAHPSFIQFQLADIFNQTVDTELYDSPTDGVTYPAGSLSPGIYIGRIMFANSDLQQSGVTNLMSASMYMTEFIISVVDGPPVITSPTDITVNQGQLFVYTVDATNIPAQLDNVSGLPAGIAFDPAGFIGGYPNTPGTYQLGLSLSNRVGTGTATLTVHVQKAGTLTITSSTRAAAGLDDPFRFQVLAPGASSAARLSTSKLPPGLSANATTGEITGAPTQAGDYTVQLRVTDGSATADGVLLISINEDPAFPTIKSPTTVNLDSGQNFTYKISATPEAVGSNDSFGSNVTDATSYSIVGKLPVGLNFDPKTGTISGKFQGSPIHEHDTAQSRLSGGALVGSVQLFATNSRGTSTVPLAFFSTPTGAVNISTRLAIAGGDNVLIGGFIVTGNAPKKLIVRALGPSLPVPGALQDPVLEIHGSDGSLLTMNDNWKSDDAQSVIDTGIAPSDDREAAIVGAFQPNVNYTAIVKGKNGASGVALVELYDLGTAALDTSSTAKLANISTRGLVQTGDNVMIGGFIISQVQSKVIARAIGPSLTKAGVSGALQDTTLELHGADGQVVASNDDWQSNQAQQIRDTGVPPTDPRESAVLATLNPGNYTAVVRGKNSATGVALVEVYALQ
ncbi:MAG: Ig domain-containing protein [Chthoniobacterales bacterium]